MGEIHMLKMSVYTVFALLFFHTVLFVLVHSPLCNASRMYIAGAGFIHLVWAWLLNKQKNWITSSVQIVPLMMMQKDPRMHFMFHPSLRPRWGLLLFLTFPSSFMEHFHYSIKDMNITARATYAFDVRSFQWILFNYLKRTYLDYPCKR